MNQRNVIQTQNNSDKGIKCKPTFIDLHHLNNKITTEKTNKVNSHCNLNMKRTIEHLKINIFASVLLATVNGHYLAVSSNIDLLFT